MSYLNYAFIKDGKITNIAVFGDPNDELLAHFKSEHQLDDLILVKDKAFIGGTWDGTKIWPPQPYPSWVKDEETNEWVAPVKMPTTTETLVYVWDEPTTSWKEKVIPAPPTA